MKLKDSADTPVTCGTMGSDRKRRISQVGSWPIGFGQPMVSEINSIVRRSDSERGSSRRCSTMASPGDDRRATMYSETYRPVTHGTTSDALPGRQAQHAAPNGPEDPGDRRVIRNFRGSRVADHGRRVYPGDRRVAGPHPRRAHLQVGLDLRDLVAAPGPCRAGPIHVALAETHAVQASGDLAQVSARADERAGNAPVAGPCMQTLRCAHIDGFSLFPRQAPTPHGRQMHDTGHAGQVAVRLRVPSEILAGEIGRHAFHGVRRHALAGEPALQLRPLPRRIPQGDHGLVAGRQPAGQDLSTDLAGCTRQQQDGMRHACALRHLQGPGIEVGAC